jgi:hypothetical protein
MDLIEFLRARLDEDEVAARVNVSPLPNSHTGEWQFIADERGMQVRDAGNDTLIVRHTWLNEGDHIARHDPARVLAEVEATRRRPGSAQTRPADTAVRRPPRLPGGVAAMGLSANRDRPVLLRIAFDRAMYRPPIDCHATGGTGECGHPLAECPDPGCPGSLCPTCGEWLCPDHRAYRDGVMRMLREAAEKLDLAALGRHDG